MVCFLPLLNLPFKVSIFSVFVSLFIRNRALKAFLIVSPGDGQESFLSLNQSSDQKGCQPMRARISSIDYVIVGFQNVVIANVKEVRSK